MSCNLIKGKIDEVKKTIQISWVQPHSLNKYELSQISEIFSIWSLK